MRYQIRETYTANRGMVPQYVDALKIIIGFMKANGVPNHTLCVDISGPLDTVYHEYEVDSLDEYFGFERGVYVEPDEQTRQLIDHINDITLSGKREIFEILDTD
jgi:hypothetical protein